jgi:hypothetical protein
MTKEKKNRQHNGQKKNRQHNGQKKSDSVVFALATTSIKLQLNLL